jgi:hypothetical protein
MVALHRSSDTLLAICLMIMSVMYLMNTETSGQHEIVDDKVDVRLVNCTIGSPMHLQIVSIHLLLGWTW